MNRSSRMIQIYQTKLNGVWYGAAVQAEKVIATCFSVEEPNLRRLLRRLSDSIPFQVAEEPNQLLTNVLGALQEVFSGKDRESYGFKIAMDHLSIYSREVLNCTCLIPVGYVTTYGSIAKVVGGCARSVGRVEASNCVPLLIPCHRVVCSDLSIGGYGQGKETKLEILHREKRGYEESRSLEVKDGELSLFPTEGVKKTRRAFKR